MKKIVDCRGLPCPKPVILCREIVEKDNPQLLEVIVDNQAAVENVSRFLAAHGYEVKSEGSGKNEWRITATHTSDIRLAPADSKTSSPSREDNGKTLILISSETFGHGDDKLGAGLMVNFLATLPELGDDLWRIILLNGGVKLAATRGACLDSLKSLENSGVSILVCGTCLNHYGLLEQKEVGETTNMLDVITSLAIADKVIRP